jgi:2',3'-cyclic-nucleotide 2'-phosphodiesterase (5'-nucleotidase family)
LLDTGDALIGDGILGNKTRGEAIVAGMNLMHYDAMALGPKELSLGANQLEQRMEEASFPILSANVTWADTGELVAPPYTLLDVDDYRVGVIGLTRRSNDQFDNLVILEPRESLVSVVPEVAEKSDTLVLLTNLTFHAALELVRTVPGIDLVVAALPAQLPGRAIRIPETGTLAVTADQAMPRHAGRRVGRLVVTLGSDGALGGESWASVPMAPEIADDPEMRALLDTYR